jgi:hypothetical protein
MEPRRIAEVEERLAEAARDVAANLMATFESLKTSGSADIYSDALGYAFLGELGPDGGPHPSAHIKFVLAADTHIRRSRDYLPFLAPIAGRKAFEIGVGAGYLFVLLNEALSVDMTGIDVRLDEQAVYREMRRRLGIDGRVREWRVRAYEDIPIPAGTEAVIATWAMFAMGWDLAAHEWFVDHCAGKLVGERMLLLQFNSLGYDDVPGAPEFYQRIGTFPKRKDRRFCIVRL